MADKAYKRHFIIFGYAVMITAIVWAAFYILGKFLLPFAVAWLAALLFQPLINRFVKLTKLPRRIAGGAILVILLAFGILAAFLIANRAYGELKVLVNNLGENTPNIVGGVTDIGNSLIRKLKLSGSGEASYITETVAEAVQSGIGTLTSGITSRLGDFIMKLPEIFFITAVFIMASFYLISDFGRVNRYISSILPGRSVRVLGVLKNRIFDTAVKYFRAYMIILAITFAELLTGFLILGVRYALILAAVIALLDLLPAIGVGTVLVPWSVISFLTGDIKTGAGLLILLAVMMIVRQIAESHIIGSQLGIPAIVTLLAMYIGFRSAGLIGLIAAPFAAVIMKNFLTYYSENQTAGFSG